MEPVILMRASLAEEAELEAARQYFHVTQSRGTVPDRSLVIGRYSVLPYYSELVDDMKFRNSELINSYEQHCYVADLKEWYQDLKGLTPRTWFELFDYKQARKRTQEADYDKKEIPPEERVMWSTPIVLKGNTNSLKRKWHTHMFAQDESKVDDVYRNLSQDSLMADQDIYLREFIYFRKYENVHSIGGAPVTDEYRFFVLDGKIMASGFYWSEHEEEVAELYYGNAAKVPVPASATRFVTEEVIPKIKDKIRFVVVDVARVDSPTFWHPQPWMVVELNDGQMSGLSGCNPLELYQNMRHAHLGPVGGSGPYR